MPCRPSCTTCPTEGDDIIAQLRDTPRTFDCTRCGTHLQLGYPDEDVTCDRCHTPFNSFGQELRRDWASNPAWRDHGINDMEGFEIAQLATETRRG